MTGTRSHQLQVGSRTIPVVLPSVRDSRLHVAAVIITVHLLGLTTLGFRVSVPQILSAVVVAALVDVAWSLRERHALVWPASGMLTGSGVALILRVVGMESGDYWRWEGWHYFAAVAGLSVLSKHVIRYRGTHLFNPSNVGLVVAFLLLGRSVIEPLDFWWGPWSPWLALAYTVIVGGGSLITRRLRLLEMAVVFWVVLAAALWVLAWSGHCMTADWSFGPVCDARFWSVVVFSPEVMVFMFFMITDPKTVPTGRIARVVFSLVLGVLAALLIATQLDEFGAKVALLGSLVLLTPFRHRFDVGFADRAWNSSGAAGLLRRLAPQGVGSSRSFVRGGLVGVAMTLVGVSIVIAGTPARDIGSGSLAVAGTRPVVEVDPESLPPVAAEAGVFALIADQAELDRIAVNLAENLAIEGEAVGRGDGSLLIDADTGKRLAEMQQAVADAIATGVRVVDEYRFDRLEAHVTEVDGPQSGAALAFEGAGTLVQITRDAFGDPETFVSSRFETTFVMSQLGGDRWLLTEVGRSGN